MIRLVSALLLVLASLAPAQSDPQPSRVEVAGSVELDEAAALRSAQEEARSVAWEQFGELWLEVVGPLVPPARAERELRAWLIRALPQSDALAPVHFARFESSVGEAVRGETSLATQGEAAQELLQAGEEQARKLRKGFHRRYLALVLTWLLLFVATGKVDRATQGYLTGRLRLGALALAILGAAVIWPHGTLLVG